MSAESPIARRPLESELFGVPVFSSEPDTIEEVRSAVAAIRAQPASLLVLRTPGERVEPAQEIEASGGRLCDVLLKLRRVLRAGDVAAADITPGIRVRLMAAADIAGVRDLATAAFTGFVGHWHADLRIARQADVLYANWAEALARTSSASSPVWVAVSEDDRRIDGFLAVRTVAAGHYDVPLTAVHPSARGRGTLRQLLGRALSTLAADTGVTLDYETQLRNMPALRTVTALGFTPVSSRLTFHLWADRMT